MVEFQKALAAEWDFGKLKNTESSPILPQSMLWEEFFPSKIIAMVRIVELVFGCCRSGWDAGSLELLERFIWRHNIMTEEVEAFTECTITLHNLTYVPEDILAPIIIGVLFLNVQCTNTLNVHPIKRTWKQLLQSVNLDEKF